jgi:hypothetical protein
MILSLPSISKMFYPFFTKQPPVDPAVHNSSDTTSEPSTEASKHPSEGGDNTTKCKRQRESSDESSDNTSRHKRVRFTIPVPKPNIPHGDIYTHDLGDKDAGPQRIDALVKKGIVTVAAGHEHFAAIDVDGQVWTWGSNKGNALGRNGDEKIPAMVKLPCKVVIVQIRCGGSITVALSSIGRLYAWGSFKVRV